MNPTEYDYLGISFGCARCHDHPVDPMTTEEYYQLTATFWDQVKEAPQASRKRIPLEITEPRVLRRGSWGSPGAKVQPGWTDAPHLDRPLLCCCPSANEHGGV